MGRRPTGAHFNALCRAYRSHGGSGSGEELAARLASPDQGSLCRLGRSIERQPLLSVRWMDAHWLPRLQFKPRDRSTGARLRPVLTALEQM